MVDTKIPPAPSRMREFGIQLAPHDVKEKAKEYGLVGVINKPLTIENFTEMLQTLSMS